MLPAQSPPRLPPGDNSRCYGLVPCAGVGLRAGAAGPKQYAALVGQSVVAHTLAALSAVPRLAATLVVLSPTDTEFETHAPRFSGPRAWVARCGGHTRAASVAAGLQDLRARGVREHDWVLVHDAARCLLQPAWVDRLIDACLTDEVGGLLALPVADTVKSMQPGGQRVSGTLQGGQRVSSTLQGGQRVSSTLQGGQRVSSTLPRANKQLAQTPQMFRLGLLQRALDAAQAAGVDITDESSAVEFLGLAPLLVPGEFENLKVTWPADFALARRLLETR